MNKSRLVNRVVVIGMAYRYLDGFNFDQCPISGFFIIRIKNVFSNYEGEKQDLCESKLKLESQVKQLEEANANISSELELAKAKVTTDADNVNKEVSKMAEIIESLQNDKLQTDKQLAEGTQLLAKVGFQTDA